MYRSYLLGLTAVFTVVVACVVGINVWVDPYDLFGSSRQEGFNAVKPQIATKVRTAKLYQVMHATPRAIVTGNSRPEMGLNPTHPCWPENARPVYQMAVPGLLPYKQYRYGQHAMAAGDVRLVLVGIDFMEFLTRPDTGAQQAAWPDTQQEPMGVSVTPDGAPNDAFVWDEFQDKLNATLSLDALKDSVLTVLQQDAAGATTRTELGFNPSDGYYRSIVAHEGQQVLFQQKNLELAKWMASWNGHADISRRLAAFRGFLQYAHSKNSRVIAFINPYHADYLTLIDQSGLWPLFERWKREVARIAEDEGGVTVWDFSDFDSYSTEMLSDQAQDLQWFWEPAHYNEHLGQRMLTRMLQASCPRDLAVGVDGFGQRLNTTRITEHLSGVVARRRHYYAAHQPHLAKLQQLLASVRSP